MKYEVFWKNPGYRPRPKLKKDIECEYLVVGGGVLGVSLAYFLAKNHKKNIVLIDKNEVASGATGKAAGTITIRGELDLRDVVTNHGKNRGVVFWKSSHEGLSMMKEIIKKEKIKCDFEPQDTLYGGLRNENHKFILEEYALEDEIERDTKLLSEIVSDEEMHQHIKTDLFQYAILSPGHGVSVNPLAYTQNLSKAIEKYGVSVYENTPLIKIKENVAFTPHGKIKFKQAIMAIDVDMKNKNVKNRKSTIAMTERLSKKQIEDIGFKIKKFVWTTKNSYEYLKLTKDNRLLVGGGDLTVRERDRDIKPAKQHLKKIEKFLADLFPQLKVKFESAWSGTYGVTTNYIPVIDIKDNVISVGGASSQLVCTITAKYLADKLAGKSSALDRFFWV